jgi:protein-tyrosine phosphatase
MRSSFYINWVLKDRLALGPAPKSLGHLDFLTSVGIISILSLCAESEIKGLEFDSTSVLENNFQHYRFVLPDHKAGRSPTTNELQHALLLAENALSLHPPLFIHCVASMERSPLVCLGILMRKYKLSSLAALDYLHQIHPPTNPLPEQLAILNQIK